MFDWSGLQMALQKEERDWILFLQLRPGSKLILVWHCMLSNILHQMPPCLSSIFFHSWVINALSSGTIPDLESIVVSLFVNVFCVVCACFVGSFVYVWMVSCYLWLPTAYSSVLSFYLSLVSYSALAKPWWPTPRSCDYWTMTMPQILAVTMEKSGYSSLINLFCTNFTFKPSLPHWWSFSVVS